MTWLMTSRSSVLPYQKHSATSKDAAQRAEKFAERAVDRVLALLIGKGPHGATDEEMQLALGMNPNTQRPRRVELQQRGFIAESGRLRDTSSGRKAVVWINAALVEKG